MTVETIDMREVSSNNVASVGYDTSSATLQVTFNNGTSYQYFDVPEHLFDELYSAGSVGGYLAAEIKGSYRYSKV
ncbi:MAG: hypothetical protein ACI9FJ_001398 [Alteromonadaceae bacterium]|jgi:hypothetical protein